MYGVLVFTHMVRKSRPEADYCFTNTFSSGGLNTTKGIKCNQYAIARKWSNQNPHMDLDDPIDLENPTTDVSFQKVEKMNKGDT